MLGLSERTLRFGGNVTGKRLTGLVLLVIGIGAAAAGGAAGLSPAAAFYGGGGGAAALGLLLIAIGGEAAPPPNYASMSQDELLSAPGPKCRACKEPTRWVLEYKKHYCNTCRLYATS